MTASRSDKLRALRAVLHAESARERPPVKSDINVTPLVDVVLVLLIIFMVVTPLIASGVAVDLPRTRHHARKPDDGKDLIVSITAAKQFYLGALRFAREEDLARELIAQRRRFPDKSIFIKGDARAPYGAVRTLMATLHDADIDDVILGTEEMTEKP